MHKFTRWRIWMWDELPQWTTSLNWMSSTLTALLSNNTNVCKINAATYLCIKLSNQRPHRNCTGQIAQLRQQCYNPKCAIFLVRILKVLKCYNFPWVQRRQNCSPAASLQTAIWHNICSKCIWNVSFFTKNSKIPNFELWHSCRKWVKYMW